MMEWSDDDGEYLILLTNQGLSIIDMINGVPQIDTLTFENSDSTVSMGPVNEMVVLNTGSGNLDLMLFSGQDVWSTSISGKRLIPLFILILYLRFYR